MPIHKNSTFSCEGADIIIEEIEKNSSGYTHAYLDTYSLNSIQVEKLAQAIRKNNYLKYINLFDCCADKKQLNILLLAIQDNVSIDEVIINQDIGSSLYQAFIEAVNKKADSNSKVSLTR